MNSGAILFTNFTSEDFTPTWNKVPYHIPAGQSIMLELGIAETFAKHLIDRELNKAKKSTGDASQRQKLWVRIFPTAAKKVEGDETRLRHEVANANAGQALPEAPKAEADADAEDGAFPDLKK